MYKQSPMHYGKCYNRGSIKTFLRETKETNILEKSGKMWQ